MAATDKPPLARWGHTACVSGSKLFVFGGTGNRVYGDCYIFDLDRNVWEPIETQGQVPSARFGHSCCPSPASTKEFILFGGHGIGNKHYNELHFFNTETLTWKKTAPDRTFPEARAGHTMTMFPSGKCVVFGGHSKSDKFYNSVHIFNYGDMTWKKLDRTEGDIPTPRGGHSAVAYNNELIIFGGFDGKKHYNDIHALDIERGVWRKVAVNGSPPTGRSGHASTLVADKHLMVVGGCQNTVFLNDVHVLQLDTMTWAQPTVTGQALRPRFRHTVTLVGRNQMIIFGGSSSGVLYNDLGAIDVTLYVSPQHSPALPKAKKATKRVGSSPVESPTSKGQYKLMISGNEGDKHMSSPAEFSALVKDFAEGVEKPQVGLQAASSSSGAAQPPNPSGVHLMQMFLSASMAYKEEHRLREQAELALQEVRKALFSEQKQKEKVEESRATAEADLVCEREDAIKLRNAKAALEKEIKSERKKRKQAEEDKAKVEEELRRLKGAANREVEKRREQEKSSVEIEELNKQLGQLKLKIANKKEKLKAASKEIAILTQREKERLVDEDASYYATPDFNKLGMDELLRLEEHYLSSLRVVGVAKQKQLQLQVEELQRAKAMLEEQKICSICADREIRVVLIPCGHRCLCRECSTVLNKCPICRKAVSDRIDTY